METPQLFSNVYRTDSLSFWDGATLDYKKVVEFLDLNQTDVSRLAGVSKASVRYDEKIPAEIRERLEQVANICNLVFEFFGDDVKTALWFKTPNPLLGNVSPRDMLRFGRYKKLLRFVSNAMEEEQARAKRQEDILSA